MLCQCGLPSLLQPGGSPRTALQQVRPRWSTGQHWQELQRIIPWARHWLIHKTLLASHSRPTELYTQKQILVKAAFITINKSRPEQTGLPWFPLFSIPISILSACCFIFPKMNSSTQQMNEKPVYICKFGGKMVTLPSFAKEGRNPGKVCLPLHRKTTTQQSWAALLPLLTHTVTCQAVAPEWIQRSCIQTHTGCKPSQLHKHHRNHVHIFSTLW